MDPLGLSPCDCLIGKPQKRQGLVIVGTCICKYVCISLSVKIKKTLAAFAERNNCHESLALCYRRYRLVRVSSTTDIVVFSQRPRCLGRRRREIWEEIGCDGEIGSEDGGDITDLNRSTPEPMAMETRSFHNDAKSLMSLFRSQVEMVVLRSVEGKKKKQEEGKRGSRKNSFKRVF
ncbi:predicted protein [Arabidopsis lyrata subsp. lyrata]|uniref:Predicted protein n=1 Tax=Arabidopsis lyrata subsp. lyrata TaxID=81972 RepID=D7LNS9_ARALL|nr:predicted protein [Arabidopsis lyrata subsp. lyrata]